MPIGSDHLQLIKFWPSRAPWKGVCGWAKIFGSALLQPARSVCVSLSAFFVGIAFAFFRDDGWRMDREFVTGSLGCVGIGVVRR